MNNILTATQVAALKDIGNKIDENKVNRVIEQAQTVDLFNLLVLGLG